MSCSVLRWRYLTLLCLLASGSVEAQSGGATGGVDLSGLTTGQKKIAQQALHDQDCTCKCGMKVDTCRTADPSCSYSKGLAQVITEAAKQGKAEPEILAAAKASKFAHVEGPKLLEDPVSIPIAGSPVTGPSSAPITLVEFSDFQCPYCAAAVSQIANIMKAYPSQVKLIFKQYPLETHPQAALAAAAALAAHKQGKFWNMYDALFAHSNELSPAGIRTIAGNLGLNMQKFDADVNSTDVREAIARDVQDGDHAGVEGTPTLFINGQRYNGSLDLEAFKPVLQAVLNKSAVSNPQTASIRQ